MGRRTAPQPPRRARYQPPGLPADGFSFDVSRTQGAHPMGAVIETNQLTKRYGHSTALDALDLQVDQGEVFGYLGPNGAGKSTTISLLLGLIRASSGQARLFGLDAWHDAPVIHRRLAYVPSEANLWPSLTGAEAMQLLANLHGS